MSYVGAAYAPVNCKAGYLYRIRFLIAPFFDLGVPFKVVYKTVRDGFGKYKTVRDFRRYVLEYYGACLSVIYIGVSPSGKAHDFDSCMRRFESCHPSHLLLDIIMIPPV